MQPEDPKAVFQPPQETEYFSQPTDDVVASADPELPATGQEAQRDNVESLDEVVSWEAPEYIHKEKNPLWFVGFAMVTIGLIILDIFVIKSFFFSFSFLVVVMAVALVVYSYRPADDIHYVLSDKGIYINDTLHGFAEFKSFGVIHDGNEFSVELIPIRRFRPSLAVYFPEEQGEAIVDALGVRLPMQIIKPDFFDKITRSLGL